MGSGASTPSEETVSAVSTASVEDIRKALKSAPQDVKDKLLQALNEGGEGEGTTADGWKVEYCVSGEAQVKDGKLAETIKLLCEDAKIQVVEEDRAPRMIIMGQPTDATPPNRVPSDEAKARMYWLASFENKEAYVKDHRARESNKIFSKAFQASLKHWAPADPEKPTMQEMMEAGAKSMAGSYMGPYYYLEKPEAALTPTTYSIVMTVRCKSAEAAREFVALCKENGPSQLQNEPNALAYAIIPPPAVGVPEVGADEMPGEKDETTVRVIESFRTLDDYTAHKQAPHLLASAPKVLALINNAATDIDCYEFANTQHFAKPN